MHTLKNDFVEIAVNALGAELQSLKDVSSGLEYIWQGDPNHWKNRAPVLFPIVGALPGGSMEINGQSCSMGNHGFTRNSLFVLDDRTETSLSFSLSDREATRRQYPYGFKLTVTYALQKKTLRTTFCVDNENDVVLPFSIGAHTGFRVPLREGEKQSDYYVVFEKKETVSMNRLEDGYRTDEYIPFLQNEDVLQIEETLFDRGAVVFEEIASKSVHLSKGPNRSGIKFEFNGFPHFALWSISRDAEFICLEPWYGLPGTKTDGDFMEKKGLIKLDPRTQFSCDFDITLCS